MRLANRIASSLLALAVLAGCDVRKSTAAPAPEAAQQASAAELASARRTGAAASLKELRQQRLRSALAQRQLRRHARPR